MSARNKGIIEQVNAAFERNDVDGLLVHCADDFRWTMVGSKPIQGKDAIREFMGQAPAEPPKFTVDTVVAEGDVVTCVGDMTMTSDGSVVPYSYCDVWRFEGEKIVELKAFVIKTDEATG